MSHDHQCYLAVIGGLLSRTANQHIGWNPARRPHTHDAHTMTEPTPYRSWLTSGGPEDHANRLEQRQAIADAANAQARH